MTYAAATFPGVTAFDRRAGARVAYRRTGWSGAAVGLGTVSAAGLLAASVMATAAWMMAASFTTNARLEASTPMALETGALTRRYSMLARATDFSKWAGVFAPSPDASDRPHAAERRERVAAVPAPTPDADPATTGSLAAASIRIPDAVFDAEPMSAVALTFAPVGSVPAAPARPARLAKALPLPPPRPLDAPQSLGPRDTNGRPVSPMLEVADADPASLHLNMAQKRVLPRPAPMASPWLPGLDSHTAIYDIEAHTVYLPGGQKLEAHSGLGARLDDPRFISVKDRGPTPPNVYDLTLRGELFHGVRALRLNPVGDNKMYGRDGILAHTYMLGPSGQSFGCVSFKNYPEFLDAFLKGKVERLVVVPHIETKTSSNDPARRTNADRYAANNR